MPPASVSPRETWVTRRFWVAAAAAFLLFSAYGSLVPFHLREIAAGDAFQMYASVVARPLHVRPSRTDLVANVLLFVPIGFCLAGAFRLDRRAWWAGPVATLATLTVSLPWSGLLEFLQVFTVDRTPSVSDIAAQTLGCLAGVVAWEASGDSLTAWMRGTLAARSRIERLERVLAVYAVAWLLVNLAPFDVTLDIGTLVARLRGGGIHLVPVPFAWPRQSTTTWLWDASISTLAALPLGALAVLGWTEGGTRRSWPQAARLALGALLLVEAAQVFIASHAADVNDLLFGSLGIGAGIWVASCWSPRQLAGGPPTDRVRAWALAGLVGWSVVLAAYHWRPFDFRLDGTLVRNRLADLSFVPFAAYRAGSDLSALSQVLVKGSLAVPLGVLCSLASGPGPSTRSLRVALPLRRARGHPVRRRAVSLSKGDGACPSTGHDGSVSGGGRSLAGAGWLAVAAAWLTVIEAGQLLLPTRVADPTDVLVGLTGAAFGFLVGAWIRHGR